MKKDYTEIAIVLDESGSMQDLQHDTIGGFNTFLSEQKSAPGRANLTLVKFSTSDQIVMNGVNIQNVAPLTTSTYRPSGGTALLDAIGRTIDRLGARLAEMPEAERPANVMVVIMTDGEENQSRRFTRGQIFDKIKHQQDVYNWTFSFIGANQDAIAVGASYGVPMAASVTYGANSLGVESTFNILSSKVGTLRSTGNFVSYTAEERCESLGGAESKIDLTNVTSGSSKP